MTPRTHTDPAGDKARALRHATSTAKRAEASEAALHGAIALASETGASLREIAAATGVPHNTVKRIIDRLVRT